MKDKLINIIKESISKLIDEDLEIEITIPKNNINGDYSTNIAMKLVSKLNTDPINIAGKVVDNILENNIIKDIKIEKPGFINFFMSNDYLFENLNTIIENKEEYGKNNIGNNKKVNLEFVSANPTGYLHLGHARSAFYGSSLANILTNCGYDVTKEYYINDAGNQINNLEDSVKVRYLELCGLDVSLKENGYHGNEIIVLAKEIFNKYGNSLIDEDTNIFKEHALTYLLNQIKEDLEKTNVYYDVWTSESDLYKNNLVKETLNLLKEKDCLYEEDAAVFLKTTKYFDDKDRVIIKNDKTYTYLLPDIAYHLNKISRGYEILIDVLGADHHGYINRLNSSLELLGFDSNMLEIKILQLVKLIKDGEEVKMSKRSGKSITLNDLIDMIGLTRARYFMVSKSLDSKMDLDIDIITKETNDNPIFYIEYANARISSILNNNNNNIKINEYKTIDNEPAISLLKKLYEYEEVLILASNKREVHLITNYLYQVATLFHSYYNSEKILTEDETYTNERLNLLLATKIVINNGLKLIEIKPREKM